MKGMKKYMAMACVGLELLCGSAFGQGFKDRVEKQYDRYNGYLEHLALQEVRCSGYRPLKFKTPTLPELKGLVDMTNLMGKTTYDIRCNMIRRDVKALTDIVGQLNDLRALDEERFEKYGAQTEEYLKGLEEIELKKY